MTADTEHLAAARVRLNAARPLRVWRGDIPTDRAEHVMFLSLQIDDATEMINLPADGYGGPEVRIYGVGRRHG